MSDPAGTDSNGMEITASNRLCRLAGLVILLAATGVFHVRSPIFGDFVQFEMAGLVDRAGAWDALYPVPIAGSVHNAGSSKDSLNKPLADEIAITHGIDFVPYHFILPPPAALLFWPLGFLDGVTAHQLWLLGSVFLGWITAVQAGMVLTKCAGRETKWAGFLTLVISATPAMRRMVLVANLTPLMSATIGWAVLCLTKEEGDLESAAAIVLGTVMKYAAAVLLPIALVQRRWRTIGWGMAISIVWFGIALAVMGRGPFIEFATKIAPTLARSHEMADNISLMGVLLHARHELPPLPENITAPLSLARILVLCAILVPMIRLGRDRMREPAAVCASATALLGWLFFFSPVAWSHYLICLCPLWGWLACQPGRNSRQRAVAWIAMGLIIFSPDQMPAPAIDPWGVRLLVSLGLMLGVGMVGLYRLIPSAHLRRVRFRNDAFSRPATGVLTLVRHESTEMSHASLK
jgi:hypothetical protein